MTTPTDTSPWTRVAEALGTADDEPEVRTTSVPAGWDRLRSALSGSSADVEAPVADDRRRGPQGWDVLGAALGAGGGDTAPGEEPGAEEVDEVPAARRRRGTRVLRRAWSTRRGKAVVAVVAAGAVVGGVVAATAGGGALPSSDAFSVNGHALAVSTFTTELQVRQTLYGIQPPPASDTAKHHTYLASAAQAEAVSLLLDQLAPKAGVTVSTQTAEQSLNEAIQSQYGGSQSAFTAALGAAGLNETQVLAEVQHNLVYQKLFTKIVGTPAVTTAQIQRYFDANKAALAVPETRQISHIVVSSQSAAQSLVDQLKAGASFATLAASQSLDTSTAKSGGVLGNYARDDLQAPFAAAAFAAPLTTPFGPVKDTSGWEVGEVTAIHPAAPAALNATTSAAIRTLLTDQAQANAWDAWLGAQLRKAHITYNAAYRPASPYAPPQIPVPKLTGETLAGVGPSTSGSAATGTPSAGGAAPSGTGG